MWRYVLALQVKDTAHQHTPATAQNWELKRIAFALAHSC